MTTLALQKSLNAILVPKGYVALVEDDKLGKKTCGAAKQFLPDQVPAECAAKGFEAPLKMSASTASVTSPVAIPTTQASLLSSTKWIIGVSVALGLGLVGFAVAQKKGWIGGQ